MEKINFEDGQLVTEGYVEIDGVQHQIHEAEYSGDTPLSAHVMNKLQDNLERELITSKTTEVSESLTITDSAPVNGKLNINSGKSVQATRSGKNKLEFVDGTYTDKNVTAVVEDGVITLNGNPSSTSFVFIDKDFNYTFKANQKYTISLNNSNMINSDEARFRLADLNGDKVIKDIYFNSINKKETFYFTKDTLVTIIQIRTGTSITYNNFIIKPQLEIGETATEWEQGGVSPSPDYPSEVKSCGDDGQGGINIITCNKNFFESPLIGYSIFGNDSEGYSVSKITNGVTYIAKLKNNQNYYIKKNNNIGDRFRIVLFKDYPVSTTYLKDSIQIAFDANLSEYGFNSDKYNYVAFTVNASSIYSGDCLAQLELGSISTSYQEHQSQLITVPTQKPFRSIGDYKDTFVKIDDKWYEKHFIGKIVFDGSESYWGRSGASTENVFVGTYNLHEGGIKTTYGDGNKWLVNRFTYGNLGVVNKFCAYNGNAETGYMFIALTVSTSLASDLTTFKNWLSANNVEVYYVLAEPELIECTALQNERLYQLEHLPMYEDITYITCIDEIKPDIQATYLYNNDLNKCYGAKVDKLKQNDIELEQKIEELDNNKLNKQNILKTISATGWYRVAKYNNNGQNAIAFTMNINSRYSNNNNQSSTINVNLTYQKARLTSVASLVNENTISKVRAVLENNITYIEIYYNASYGNPVAIDIVSQDQWNDTYITMLDFETPTDTISVLDEVLLNQSIQSITTGVEFETGRIIDGKKEYGKRVRLGNLPNNETKDVAHGISNITFTKIEGICDDGLGDRLPLPYINIDSLGESISMYIDGANIRIKSYSDKSTYVGYATLYYTKN